MESGHSRLLNCVAAGTLKIPVSPADAFKPTLSSIFFLINYSNPEISANIDRKGIITKY